MNVVMALHHEVGEEDPNRVVGEEEAVVEKGIEEGIGIDRETLVGRREVGGVVALGGANVLGHEEYSPSPQFLVGVGRA